MEVTRNRCLETHSAFVEGTPDGNARSKAFYITAVNHLSSPQYFWT